MLSQRYRTLKSEGNKNNEIGVPLTLLNMRAYHERAVIEMGMYAQEKSTCSAISPGPSSASSP